MTGYTDKALATRERILEAANALFYAHGYHATGLDRIIARAGVTKGNFYYYFKSKEALAAAVLTWHRDLAFRELDVARLRATHPPREALLALLAGIARRVQCEGEDCEGRDDCAIRGCFFGNFALEMSAGSPLVRHTVAGIFAELRGLVADLLRRAQAAGEVRADLDPEATARLILSLLEGAILLDKTGQEAREIPHALAFVERSLTPAVKGDGGIKS